MSGTASGTIVPHVTPETAVWGPLALVRIRDTGELYVEKRRLELLVGEEEPESRRNGWEPVVYAERGYLRLYQEHVLQADKGCDFDFLRKPG